MPRASTATKTKKRLPREQIAFLNDCRCLQFRWVRRRDELVFIPLLAVFLAILLGFAYLWQNWLNFWLGIILLPIVMIGGLVAAVMLAPAAGCMETLRLDDRGIHSTHYGLMPYCDLESASLDIKTRMTQTTDYLRVYVLVIDTRKRPRRFRLTTKSEAHARKLARVLDNAIKDHSNL